MKANNESVMINFLIIGGQRCATGWISQCLREHPDVYMAKDETRFFDRNFENGLAWWKENFFLSWNNQKAVGEKTANYLSDNKVPERIHKTLPGVRLVCCLRNPVDRLYSGFMMKARSNPGMKKLMLKELLQQEPDLVDRGRYYTHLKLYLSVFPKERVLILLYDDKVKSPRKFIQSIYSFINVDSGFIPPSLDLQIKPGAAENSNPLLARLSSKLLHRHSPFRKIYSTLRPNSSPLKLSSSEIEYLLEIYRDETIMLEALIGRDLSEWRNYG